MGELSKLKGLGAKSERSLNEIGIYTKEDLEITGAVRAFLQMEKECSIKPGLNFLYAMVGALENKSWIEIAKQEKERLIFEIEGCKELDNLFSDENSVINK